MAFGIGRAMAAPLAVINFVLYFISACLAGSILNHNLDGDEGFIGEYCNQCTYRYCNRNHCTFLTLISVSYRQRYHIHIRVAGVDRERCRHCIDLDWCSSSPIVALRDPRCRVCDFLDRMAAYAVGHGRCLQRDSHRRWQPHQEAGMQQAIE